MAALDEPKSTTFDSGEPYLGLILSNRRVREVNRHMSSWPAFREGMHHIDRLVALVIPQAGNLRFLPPSSYLTQESILRRVWGLEGWSKWLRSRTMVNGAWRPAESIQGRVESIRILAEAKGF
ncbi:hypothetical protein PIB30_052490 [Stylosanthes scabra]|uniref:Uncharacterized protein n=1 Tax=Stylosanthes scabra TaxID=79078 RepID=A0ABU6THY7_9FABA|nr:hypothetical protein [Stylosanthes scabra]